jgi:Pterin binding enzyme
MLLQLGRERVDVDRRPVVVGILNRTRDSFFDRGAHYCLDRLLERAEQLVADGADVLEVGARPGGVGVAEVGPAEERDLAAGTVAALRSRFDLPLAVDTTRAVVAEAAFAEGAVLGNDMSGFRDPGYLPAVVAAGAAVVATHIRRPPGLPDPDPHFDDLLGEVTARLAALARSARDAGVPDERIVVDPGIDLGSPGPSRCGCSPAWAGWPRSAGRCCCRSRTRSSCGGPSIWPRTRHGTSPPPRPAPSGQPPEAPSCGSTTREPAARPSISPTPSGGSRYRPGSAGRPTVRSERPPG